MTGLAPEPLVTIVTTDLAAITRGRSVAAGRLDKVRETGIGWLHANISLTAFNAIADPNPWGSRGDLRIVPDPRARFTTAATGAATPFDMVIGDIVELDGKPWLACTRNLLRQALADFKSATGLSLVASFEHEFQIVGAAFPPAHSFSLAALRRADPFGPRLMAALAEAGVEPETFIAEFGLDQFEVTAAPAEALLAADRAVAIREITRETARNMGWQASFAPKISPQGIGNGVHIHMSFQDAQLRPAAYDASRPGRLSETASAFCAGILRHLPALIALTAASIPSYYRLKPHSWSSSYTWLGEQDREASLRICPTITIGGRDPAPQLNIEYRAADATGNPYVSLAAILSAGLEGIGDRLPSPPLVCDDPTLMSHAQRAQLGLERLPETFEAAVARLEADAAASKWFDPLLLQSFIGLKRFEMAKLDRLDPQAICDMYAMAY